VSLAKRAPGRLFALLEPHVPVDAKDTSSSVPLSVVMTDFDMDNANDLLGERRRSNRESWRKHSEVTSSPARRDLLPDELLLGADNQPAR
jgi:hypothetical protein